MKNKILMLCLIPTMLAVACSEGAYVPAAGTPAYNTGNTLPNNGIYPNNGMPNNGIYGNGNYTNGYMNNGIYMNAMIPRPMFSWGFHIGTWVPNYMNYMNTGNCIPSNTYVSTCSQNTVRTPCPYNTSSRTTRSSVSDNTTRTRQSSPCPYNVDRTAGTDTTDMTTKILPLSLVAETGQALYDRMAIEAVTQSKRITVRTGEILACSKDATDRKDVHYVCGFQIRMKDGVILKQKQEDIGKPAQPEIFSGTPVKTSNLIVNSTDDAQIKLAGKVAEFLFKNLPGTAKEGKVDEAGISSARVKIAGQLKCYETTDAEKVTTTGCVIRIKADTGAAFDAVI